MGKRQEDRPLERLKRRWEDNYKHYLIKCLGGCGLNSSCLGKKKEKCSSEHGKEPPVPKMGEICILLGNCFCDRPILYHIYYIAQIHFLL